MLAQVGAGFGRESIHRPFSMAALPGAALRPTPADDEVWRARSVERTRMVRGYSPESGAESKRVAHSLAVPVIGVSCGRSPASAAFSAATTSPIGYMSIAS